jgi:hypothetical protein
MKKSGWFLALLAILMTVMLPLISLSLGVLASSSVETKDRVEIIEKRTENSKTYWLGGNKYSTEISVGVIHYKDDYANPNEGWKDINLAWEGNRITKAPYELTLDGQKIIVKDKKTSDISTIELISIKPAGLKFEIVPENTRVSFRHILSSDKVPFEAQFKIAGKSLTTRAFDDEDELELETSLVSGILTEKLSEVKDKQTGEIRPAKGEIRIDPTWQVGASTDDCYMEPGYWSTILGSFSVGYGGGSSDYRSAARFLNITIPPGATITLANLILTAKVASSSTGVKTRIRAEANITPLTFSTQLDFNARVWTTAYAYWDNIAAWSVNEESADTISPDCKACIQEVINLPGWASGNNVAIYWEDLQRRGTAGNVREAYSYDGSAAKAPKLYIEYISVVAPTVQTDAADNMAYTTATLHGQVTDDGDDTIITRGFEWDTDSGAPYANDWHEDGSFGVATFEHGLTLLDSNKTYYFRAYATNSQGTSYGGELSFDTLLPLPLAPTNFSVTQTGSTTVDISWTKGTYASTTVVRTKEGSYPTDYTDGYEVYNDVGTSVTYSIGDTEIKGQYFRAWSYNDTGYSTDYVQENVGGTVMMLFTFGLIALGLTWVSTRRPELLLRLAASFLWLGMAFWLVLGDTVLDTSESWTWIIIGAMVLLCFVPLIFQMNTEVRTEKKGQMWSNWQRNFTGGPQETENERYKQELQSRTRRRARRRY